MEKKIDYSIGDFGKPIHGSKFIMDGQSFYPVPDPRINLILAFIKNGRTKAQIAKASKVSYGHLDDILHERQGLSTKMYNKIYKGLDKLVSKDTDLLQEFGMQN